MAAILTYKGLQPALFSFEATPKGSCSFLSNFLVQKIVTNPSYPGHRHLVYYLCKQEKPQNPKIHKYHPSLSFFAHPKQKRAKAPVVGLGLFCISFPL